MCKIYKYEILFFVLEIQQAKERVEKGHLIIVMVVKIENFFQNVSYHKKLRNLCSMVYL